MAGLFKQAPALVFTDEDNQELAVILDATVVPRVGENVRLRGTPYLVDRVGFDIPAKEIERIFIVCRPA